MTAPDRSRCRIPRSNSAMRARRRATMCRHLGPTTRAFWRACWGIPRSASPRYMRNGYFTTTAAEPWEEIQMGEILAVGITHYPPLAGSDETMSWILKRMLQNPRLPEKLRSAEGWPEPMRAEWSNDEGTTAARAHRERLVESLRRTRAQIDAFRPDFIVVWGDDQYENFREDVIPPYCIYAHEAFEFAPPAHNVWHEPHEQSPRGGQCRSGEVSCGRFDRGGFRHCVLVQAAASSAGARIRERGDVSRLRSERVFISDHSIRDKLLRAQGDRAAWWSARIRKSALGSTARSASADAAAIVRPRRRDRADFREQSVAGRADGVVGLVACVSDGQESFSVSRHSRGPDAVRGLARRQLRRVAELSG